MNNTELPETRRFPIEPVSKAQDNWQNRPVAMLSFYLQCPSGQLKWHGYLRYKVDWATPEFYCWIKISPRQRTWTARGVCQLPEESAND